MMGKDKLTRAARAVFIAGFALHIGSATFSYASFAIAGGPGARYLAMLKKGHSESETAMKQTDYMTYRLICLGFLLLTGLHSYAV